MYFGRYPQSEVTGDELTDEIKNAHYNDTDDAVVDGVKYRRVGDEERYDSNLGDYVYTSYKYFRYEPIKWKVLNNDEQSLLLLADNALEKNPDAGTYSTSKLRSFLNGYDELTNSSHVDYSVKYKNFRDIAFYENEQQILEYPNNNYEDLITIPTNEILTNNSYGFDSKTGYTYTRKFGSSNYVICKYDEDEGYNYGSVYLRSEFIDKWWIDEGYLSEGYSYSFSIIPLIKININSDLWTMTKPENNYETKSITDVTATLSQYSYTYDGTDKMPKVTVKDGINKLVENRDYTLNYKDNQNAGTATVELVGINDYSGTKSVNFDIAKAEQDFTVPSSITDDYINIQNKITPKRISGNGKFVYTSSDTSIAEVSAYGNITYKKPGEVVITVTASEAANYKAKEKNIALTINKEKPELEISEGYIEKYTTSSSFYLNAVHDGDGILSYTSSNTNVVTVGSTGKVYIKGSGYACITVTCNESDYYESQSAEIYIYVKKASPSLQVKNSLSLKTNSSATSLSATRKGDGLITYKTSNSNVVTVDSYGKVRVRGAGTATITVTCRSTSKYNSQTKKVTVKVTKISPNLTVKSTRFSKSYYSSPFYIGAKRNGTGKVTYKSSNTSVATVNSSGKVSIRRRGTATITVTCNETSKYTKQVRKVTVTVR